MQGGGRAIGASYTHPPRRIRRRRATRSRRSAGRTVVVECVPPRRDALRDSADGTRLERRLPRRHGWHPWRGASSSEKSGMAPPATLSLTRAPRRPHEQNNKNLSLSPHDGRAAVARLPKSYATACDLESAHTRLCSRIHSYNELRPPLRASNRQLACEESVHRHLT